uniref:CNNM transmembrane domain-containing protein n=1 Tax=Chromera velia CCMP2878 TaxID=1169474 RepID=A0A0K6S6P3_9ALVE|eukprot:Cvel_16844.t2-p1 / transcript=Cvel_16844.t2 / gene=Cvel_16844 / organism=Chromera_velia_CCMP2878 / gene_product=Metal transporter CNNM4, putative / transcript_product=Metal transporter CNNM4, putative / location=Cvel_scaffold1317:15195-20494(+) / protein_length=852 / sequence_SO=supercontig / SO=protein_coding / is_pseudo=false
MSLDTVQLQILIDNPSKTSSDQRIAKYARGIFPLREKGNLMLCTLLIGNTLVNAYVAILSSTIVGEGAIALAVSTGVLVVFGEIIPQAICSRYGLMIGYYTRPVVIVVRMLLWIVAKPISLVLDWALGREMGTIYDKNQLKALFAHHEKEANILETKEAQILTGALDFPNKTAAECMTPIKEVFGIDIDETLNFDSLAAILQAGFSRIPVFDPHTPQCIVGLLLVKDLLLVDPTASVPVRTLLKLLGREVFAIDSETRLMSLLTDFKKGRSHLAVVRDVVSPDDGDPYWCHVGIITLEDLIEEILQDEIQDETDPLMAGEAMAAGLPMLHDSKENGAENGKELGGHRDSESKKGATNGSPRAIQVAPLEAEKEEDLEEGGGTAPTRLAPTALALSEAARASMGGLGALGLGPQKATRYSKSELSRSMALGRLKLFDRRRGPESFGEAEAMAICAFLQATQPAFSPLLIDQHVLSQTIKDLGSRRPPKDKVIFRKGVPADDAVLILQGRVKAMVGQESLETSLGSWSSFGMQALTLPPFMIEFLQKHRRGETAGQHEEGGVVSFENGGGEGYGGIPTRHDATKPSLVRALDSQAGEEAIEKLTLSDAVALLELFEVERTSGDEAGGEENGGSPRARANSVIGAQIAAARTERYTPDFTAFVTEEGARIVEIPRREYIRAVKASLLKTDRRSSALPRPSLTLPPNAAATVRLSAAVTQCPPQTAPVQQQQPGLPLLSEAVNGSSPRYAAQQQAQLQLGLVNGASHAPPQSAPGPDPFGVRGVPPTVTDPSGAPAGATGERSGRRSLTISGDSRVGTGAWQKRGGISNKPSAVEGDNGFGAWEEELDEKGMDAFV